MLNSDLSDEDKHFFSQPSSWKFGPTYDTVIFVDASTDPYEVAKAALEFPDLVAWEGNPESHPFKTVLSLRDCPKIGLFHLCSKQVQREIFAYVLAIYPMQFERSIGSKIDDDWQSMDGGRLMSLHSSLMSLVRYISSIVSVVSATIAKEDVGRIKPQDRNSMYFESAVAKKIGIASISPDQPNDYFAMVRIRGGEL